MQQHPDLIQPAAEVALQNSGSVQAAFGRDAGTLIVQSNESAINLFGLVVHFWPEILGGLTFLLVVWALFRWWRVVRTPRLVGQPHCRRCGYCLTGVVEDRCPECGTPPSKSRPIIGRSLKRRAGPFLAFASIVALGYGALWAFQVPRVGYVNRLISIWSPEWYEAARQRNATFLDRLILKHGGPIIRLAEFDAATGKMRRVIHRLRGAAFSESFAVSDDGERVWTTSDGLSKLNVVSVSSGRAVRAFTIPQAFGPAARWESIAGVRPAGDTAVAVIHAADLGKRLLVEVDGNSGELKLLFEVDAALAARPGVPGATGDKFLLVPGDGPLRVVEARDASVPNPDRANSWLRRTTIVLHQLEGGRLVSREFPRCFSSQDSPAFSPDGRFMFLPTTFDAFVPVRWDLMKLEPVGYRRPHRPTGDEREYWTNERKERRDALRRDLRVSRNLWGPLVYCAARKTHYAAQFTPQGEPALILGLDENSEERVHACALPQNTMCKSIDCSKDGRRLATVAMILPGSTCRLLIYDLP